VEKVQPEIKEPVPRFSKYCSEDYQVKGIFILGRGKNDLLG
jgi:hypothetical protein